MKSIYFIFLLLLATACELVVPIELPDQEPKLVINGFLEADSSATVFLSRSYGMYEEFDIDPVSGGQVTLRENQGSALPFVQDNLDSLRFDLSGITIQPGNTYTVEATAPGFETVRGVTTVPQRMTFDKVEVDTGARRDRDSTLFDVWTLHLNDLPGEDNFYFLRVYIDTDIENYLVCFETLDPALADLDVLNNGTDVAYLCEGRFSDVIFDGTTYQLQLFTEAFYRQQPNIALEFELLHLDRAAYNYLLSSDRQYDTEGNPFAEPAIVFNNIENGFGIIGSVSSSKYRFEF